MAINKSPWFPRAERFLEKIFEKPRSLPHAVMVEVSWDKLITGKALRLFFGFNLIRNSAAKCWASAADPPFPQISTLFPPSKQLKILFIALSTFFLMINKFSWTL